MPRIPGAFRGWVAHVGAANNDSYQLFPRRPRINVRQVLNAKTGEQTPLYESPDFWIWNFCRTGFERALRFELPLGATAPMSFVINLEAQAFEPVAWQEP